MMLFPDAYSLPATVEKARLLASAVRNPFEMNISVIAPTFSWFECNVFKRFIAPRWIVLRRKLGAAEILLFLRAPVLRQQFVGGLGGAGLRGAKAPLGLAL